MSSTVLMWTSVICVQYNIYIIFEQFTVHKNCTFELKITVYHQSLRRQFTLSIYLNFSPTKTEIHKNILFKALFAALITLYTCEKHIDANPDRYLRFSGQKKDCQKKGIFFSRVGNSVILKIFCSQKLLTFSQGFRIVGLGVRELTQFVYSVYTVLMVPFLNLINVSLKMYRYINTKIQYVITVKCSGLTGQ